MLSSLQAALEVAQKIQTLLESDQWEEIEELIELRDSHINRADTQDINMTSDEQEAANSILNNLLLLNERLMAAAQLHQADLFQQIKANNKSKQMTKAYKQI